MAKCDTTTRPLDDEPAPPRVGAAIAMSLGVCLATAAVISTGSRTTSVAASYIRCSRYSQERKLPMASPRFEQNCSCD